MRKFILPMIPYPSGHLHMGHLRVYSITDTISRYLRLKGHKTIVPIGFDSFGLPAENAAIDSSLSPFTHVSNNIHTLSKQLSEMRFDCDWETLINTCDPSYYKHTQALFLDLLDHGLVTQKLGVVNWDPVDCTVLANEQVINGRAERSGALVEKKNLLQWYFMTTLYKNELLNDLDHLDWPEKVKTLQRNWIGKSLGAQVDFNIKDSLEKISCFLSEPEAICATSFITISTSHPILKLSKANLDTNLDLGKYLDTGLKAINPISLDVVPIFIASHIEDDYECGAVACVPSHDEKDLQVAKSFSIPILPPVYNQNIITHDIGCGKSRENFKEWILNELKELKIGQESFKLRDWLVSRQRFWGTPIPIIHCSSCGAVPVPRSDLPVILPTDVKLNKRGHSPLLDPSWKDCTCPKCGSNASRETDTLDTFVDSSWYYIRFLDPSNKVTYCEKSKSNNLPVDVYIGGIEHACMHLLYARFISKFLNNIGIIKTPNGEPFQKLLNQGMVKSKTFKCKSSGKYVPQSSVTDESSMIITFEKMSKSKFNGVDPSEIIKQHGIDSTRLFMLFKSHPSDDLAWETTGIIGIKRFLDKVTNLAQSVVKSDPDHHALSVFNSSVKFIDTSMDKFAFNVVIAELMKITSLLQNHPHFKLVCDLVVMIYPFAPDFATRTWLMLSDSDIISQKWPIVNDSTVLNKKLIASVIIDGKKRGTVEYPNDFKDKEIANLIYGDCNFKSYLQGEKKVAFYQSNKKMKIVSFT